MSETSTRHCPDCGTTREFLSVARTRMSLGTKVKWRCPECGFSVVNIGTEHKTGTSA